jgi:hypothetical protein
MSDISHRFAYHAPRDEETRQLHEEVRDVLGSVALAFEEFLPPGREAACAITKLEEAMFWANAAIARQPAPEPSPKLPLDTPLSTGGPSAGPIQVCTVDHYCETGGCNGRPR